MAAKDEVITFFKDSTGTYGAPRPGRRLVESERIRRRIEELTVGKWMDPSDRAQIDELLEPLQARLKYLEDHPLEDGL